MSVRHQTARGKFTWNDEPFSTLCKTDILPSSNMQLFYAINIRHYSNACGSTFRLVSGVSSQSLKCDSPDFNEIKAPRGDIIVAIHVKRNVFRHSPGNQSREISFRLILRVGKGSDPKYITPKYINKN